MNIKEQIEQAAKFHCLCPDLSDEHCGIDGCGVYMDECFHLKKYDGFIKGAEYGYNSRQPEIDEMIKQYDELYKVSGNLQNNINELVELLNHALYENWDDTFVDQCNELLKEYKNEKNN